MHDDHEVRHQREFERIRFYIENNPVRAGLVQEVCQYRWSSAGHGELGSPADEASAGSCPGRTYGRYRRRKEAC